MKVFLGAKAFESPELDSLAESMSVSDLLSSNAEERYFLTKTNVAALSFGNKLLFGARYYSNLTEGQRLAVAAHEFGHVLADGGERRERLVVPLVAVSTLLALVVFLGTGSTIALTGASVLGLLAALVARSSAGSGRYLRREMSCDKLATSFADGDALVQAIHLAESLRSASRSRLASFWRRVRSDPSTKLRIDAILSYEGAPC